MDKIGRFPTDNDALAFQELNQKAVTFGSITRRSTTWATSALFLKGN